ncbi:hypothetical protein CU098_002828, partial [Rhizopus stolonifer]
LADFNLDSALTERTKQIKELPKQTPEEELSDKAQGKLPETPEPLSRQSSNSLPPTGLTDLSGTKNGFNPTHDWVNSWHSRLPLDTITFLIDHLKPELEKFGLTGEKAVAYIHSLSPLEIQLPETNQPVQIRNFQWTESLVIWFQSMLWGHTYISSISNYGSWNNTQIKLFHIKLHQQDPQPYPVTPGLSPTTTHTTRPNLTTSKTV